MTQKSNVSKTQMQAGINTLVVNNNRFAFDLYSKRTEQNEGNLLFLPSSVSSVLAMAFAGSHAETTTKIAEAQRFTLVPERLHEALRRLPSDTRAGGVEFRIVNRIEKPGITVERSNGN